MSGQEGFRFAEDPLAAPVFDAAPAESPAAVCRGVGKTYRTATESVPALVDVSLAIPRAHCCSSWDLYGWGSEADLPPASWSS